MQNLFPIILKQGHVFVLSKNKQTLHYIINDNQNLPKELIELDFVRGLVNVPVYLTPIIYIE